MGIAELLPALTDQETITYGWQRQRRSTNRQMRWGWNDQMLQSCHRDNRSFVHMESGSDSHVLRSIVMYDTKSRRMALGRREQRPPKKVAGRRVTSSEKEREGAANEKLSFLLTYIRQKQFCTSVPNQWDTGFTYEKWVHILSFIGKRWEGPRFFSKQPAFPNWSILLLWLHRHLPPHMTDTPTSPRVIVMSVWHEFNQSSAPDTSFEPLFSPPPARTPLERPCSQDSCPSTS